jgi:hypothetical protein
MKLIAELDGRITNLWKFWSVRWGMVSATCSATVGVYEGFKAIDPAIVKDIPVWLISAFAAGAVLFTFSSMLMRGIKQPIKADDNGPDPAKG